MWFGLALIASGGAGVLLYIDRIQRQRSGRIRQIWAMTQDFGFRESDPELVANWRRAALAGQDYLTAVDIVTGVRRGDRFVLFDLEDTGTFVAVERDVASDVDIDLRPKSAPPPKDADLKLLGAMSDRVMFATDLEIARRVCDSRMATLTAGLPSSLQLLWSEGRWTLGSLPLSTKPRDWDEAIEAVSRLSAILHVLPPAVEPDRLAEPHHDLGRPQPTAGSTAWVAPAVARVLPPPPPSAAPPVRAIRPRPAPAAGPVFRPYQGPAPHA
nr:hypothetical protein [Skermania piniformis]